MSMFDELRGMMHFANSCSMCVETPSGKSSKSLFVEVAFHTKCFWGIMQSDIPFFRKPPSTIFCHEILVPMHVSVIIKFDRYLFPHEAAMEYISFPESRFLVLSYLAIAGELGFPHMLYYYLLVEDRTTFCFIQ